MHPKVLLIRSWLGSFCFTFPLTSIGAAEFFVSTVKEQGVPNRIDVLDAVWDDFIRCDPNVEMSCALKTYENCAMTSCDIVSTHLLNTFASHFRFHCAPFFGTFPAAPLPFPFSPPPTITCAGKRPFFLTVWHHGWLISQSSSNNDFLSHLFVKPYTWESESSASLTGFIIKTLQALQAIRDLCWASFRV